MGRAICLNGSIEKVTLDIDRGILYNYNVAVSKSEKLHARWEAMLWVGH